MESHIHLQKLVLRVSVGNGCAFVKLHCDDDLLLQTFSVNSLNKNALE